MVSLMMLNGRSCNRKLRMVSTAIAFFMPLVAVVAAPPAITVKELNNLQSIKSQAETNTSELQQVTSSMLAKQAELDAMIRSIDSLNNQIATTKEQRKKLEALDIDSPGSVNQTKLNQLRVENEKLFSELELKSQQLKTLKVELATLVDTQKVKSVTDKQLADKYTAILNPIVDRIANDRAKDYQKPQIVEASGIVACTGMYVTECKEKSLREAERVATERGSVIVIDSMTEINNSQLTKDQIRTATKASIANREILDAQFVSGDTAYKTTIRAEVTPVLGDQLLKALRTNARFDVEAQLNSETATTLQAPPKIDNNKKDENLSTTQSRADLAFQQLDKPNQPLDASRSVTRAKSSTQQSDYWQVAAGYNKMTFQTGILSLDQQAISFAASYTGSAGYYLQLAATQHMGTPVWSAKAASSVSVTGGHDQSMFEVGKRFGNKFSIFSHYQQNEVTAVTDSGLTNTTKINGLFAGVDTSLPIGVILLSASAAYAPSLNIEHQVAATASTSKSNGSSTAFDVGIKLPLGSVIQATLNYRRQEFSYSDPSMLKLNDVSVTSSLNVVAKF